MPFYVRNAIIESIIFYDDYEDDVKMGFYKFLNDVIQHNIFYYCNILFKQTKEYNRNLNKSLTYNTNYEQMALIKELDNNIFDFLTRDIKYILIKSYDVIFNDLTPKYIYRYSKRLRYLFNIPFDNFIELMPFYKCKNLPFEISERQYKYNYQNQKCIKNIIEDIKKIDKEIKEYKLKSDNLLNNIIYSTGEYNEYIKRIELAKELKKVHKKVLNDFIKDFYIKSTYPKRNEPLLMYRKK
jgi:hypothetical protein